nr:hypothetical protein GCM10020241_25750 [Streptoalloteichus tenebrarius]
MPFRVAADAWTLFGGYPYSEVFGDVDTEEQRLRIRRARHYLWGMRRRREWLRALERYLRVPQELRGYDLDGLESPPRRREPSRAAGRFDRYERVLTTPPAFARSPLRVAGEGEYWFPVRDRRHSVVIPRDLLPAPEAKPHDLAAPLAGQGQPLEAEWAELEDAAREMDAREIAARVRRPNQWVRRLARVQLLVRDAAKGEFVPGRRFRIDRLLHLVGMVGAGKSTLRDVLAFWAATRRGLRITVLVGDVAETLALVDVFTTLSVLTAPVIGHSTREKHLQRLHRRLATTGAETMLAHEHSGFVHLSSACPLDALRGLEAQRPLRVSQAPCESLYPVDRPPARDAAALLDDDMPAPPKKKRARRHGCPLWTRCPRHHASRLLVDAQIWVANPASLVHSGVPQHLHAERLRYLELACRRSDLVIVDEADRVQMQLDIAFAPATTLVGRFPDSWLDEVSGHKVDELAREGRLQLSERDVEDWNTAVDTVTSATNRLYARLIKDAGLRKWITEDYFSALTLHHWLINTWFPDLRGGEDSAGDAPVDVERHEQRVRQRDRVDEILDAFRDEPLQQRRRNGADDDVTPVVNELVQLTLELLHARADTLLVRDRVRRIVLNLVGHDPAVAEDLDVHAARLEFTLILAALHHRLDLMTILWPRVETALNLEATSNVLSRRPPKDYEPVVPESPMGNILGFQFQLGERNQDGDQSGELRFFRCNGVGRELLLELPHLPAIDDRPGPNVLLMSATSWAGTSSRYNINAEVGAILRPHQKEIDAVLRTEFRKEFLHWPGTTTPLRLSGCEPQRRPHALRAMLDQLAVPDRSLAGATSKLEQELAAIEDLDRRRILLLVGSYEEARRAAEHLNTIPEWTGRVVLLVSDDSDLDDAWVTLPRDTSLTKLPRGDVARFPSGAGQILVAPLLALERGHNIVLRDGRAAIGSVYFLARPHPRPDDLTLAIHAINDWAVRQVRGPGKEFHQSALAAGSPDRAGLAFRKAARRRWIRFLTRRFAWSSLPADEKEAFTWDQLVVIWQVIGRLVRGGEPARAVFVDAAFSPREAGLRGVDTPDTSLLESMRAVLAPYFTDSHVSGLDRSLVKALYQPLYLALAEMD